MGISFNLFSMARGKATSIEIREKVMASYAMTASYAETSRQIKLAENTVADIVVQLGDFGEYRALIEKGYIVRTWQRLERMEDAIEKKLMDSTTLDQTSLYELVSIAEKFHKMVTNVAAHIMALQINVVQSDSPEDIEVSALEYLSERSGKNIDDIRVFLGI